MISHPYFGISMHDAPWRLMLVIVAIVFAFSFASGLNDTDKIQDRHPSYEMQETE